MPQGTSLIYFFTSSKCNHSSFINDRTCVLHFAPNPYLNKICKHFRNLINKVFLPTFSLFSLDSIFHFLYIFFSPDMINIGFLIVWWEEGWEDEGVPLFHLSWRMSSWEVKHDSFSWQAFSTMKLWIAKAQRRRRKQRQTERNVFF